MDYKIEEIENFVTEEQEKEILKLVPFKQQNGEDRNQIVRFGRPAPYREHIISDQIPEIFNKLNVPIKFDSITINEFYKGQTLDYHFDLPGAGEKILILNLVSNAILKFKNKNGEELNFELKPRNLYIMEGKLRWEWRHGITAKEKRYSVVFRNSKEITKPYYFCSKCDSYHPVDKKCWI